MSKKTVSDDTQKLLDTIEDIQPSQTDSEMEKPGSEGASAPDEIPTDQTERKTANNAATDEDPDVLDAAPTPVLQTDFEGGMNSGAEAAIDSPDNGPPQTDGETGQEASLPGAELQVQPDKTADDQTDPASDDGSTQRAAKARAKKAAPKTGKKAPQKADSSGEKTAGTQIRTRKNAFSDGSGDAAESTEAAASTRRAERSASNGQSVSAMRSMREAAPSIVSIDTERSVESDVDKKLNAFLDLVESMKGRKILSGTIQGVERSEDSPDLSFAVVYHGDFKVIIPADETVERPQDFRGRDPGDTMHYLLTKRLGAEVDYIVKGTDAESGMAAASRLEAMAQKRRQLYFGTDRDGYNLMYDGVIAEARVISVIRAGIFVEIFGAECYIGLRELSYQRWLDAAAHYQPGQRVLVKILSINREDRNNVKVAASVKQAGEDPYEKALRRYSVGNRYVGTVSLVDTTGVFVSLDGGIDCLCAYPKRGRPPRGSRVTVRIIGINTESNRIWGAITHMTTAR